MPGRLTSAADVFIISSFFKKKNNFGIGLKGVCVYE